uniref:Uncharacterized protein n=1 Tax=Rhizophora mucronata TaxID=61149 RepID=A0A2P2Q4S8_RHIMU
MLASIAYYLQLNLKLSLPILNSMIENVVFKPIQHNPSLHNHIILTWIHLSETKIQTNRNFNQIHFWSTFTFSDTSISLYMS